MKKLERRPKRVLVGFRLVEALRDVLQGFAAYVKERNENWQIQCVDTDQFMRLLRPDAVDGAVCVVGGPGEMQEALARFPTLPIVNMLYDASPLLPTVKSDDYEIGRVGARDLLSRGFVNFGFVGWHADWSDHRRIGFTEVVTQAGHECHFSEELAGAINYHRVATPEVAKAIAEWIVTLPKPAAILAASDLIGRTVLAACEESGVRVPEEVAILGVDNIVQFCELATVPLSSVAQDFPALGYEAARMLDNAMRGDISDIRRVMVAPGGVVARRSTDVLAFGDEYVSTAMRLIHEHAEQGIGMKEILRAVPVSRRWLDERFKQLVGHTPSEEIRRQRMNRVREMLIHTDLSIKQIAMRCGFSRTENMIRFFRDSYGMPPQAYRSRHGGIHVGTGR